MSKRYWLEYPQASPGLASRLKQNCPHAQRLAGKITPSGRVSIGVVPRQKPPASPPAESSFDYSVAHHRCHWDADRGIVREAVLPVGLSSVPNHHDTPPSSPRPRYGLQGMTRQGKSRLQEGCFLLECNYHVRRAGFYTLTCPYTDLNLIADFNRNISEVQRRYFQKCKRAYEKRGQHWHYVSVLEFQPKRWERDWVAALHIHYVAPAMKANSREFVLQATQLREMWRDACTEVLGVVPDTSASVDSQLCKKSLSGYLAKYMSKGGEILEQIADMDTSQLPRQWWSMSAFLRAEVKRQTVDVPSPICEYWFGGGGSTPGELLHLVYRKDIYLQYNGDERRIGLVGRLCRDGMSAMLPPTDFDYSTYRCSVKSCSLYSRRAVDKN